VGKWYWSRPRAERWIWAACVLFAPFELAAKAFGHTVAYGDFNVHRDFGMRFLQGTPLYKGGHCFNYMPISALFYAPLAMVPPPLASLGRTGLAMVCLVYVMRTLGAMVRGQARAGPWPGVAVAACAVLLCGQYVLRDLDDGGPHLIYLAMILGAMQAVRRGREGRAALGFGLAIALKMTPGLFLPFFVWKRRWRLAVYTSLATAAWIALPSVWMGPGSWWRHQDQWNRLALDVFASRMDQAREFNEVRVQNQALKPAVTRLLVAYPAGHPLKVNHPLDFPVLHLDEPSARRVATLVCLGLLGGVAWWSRRRWSEPDDPRFPLEMAAVLVLMPLLSPVTWLQHLSFLLPATYLLAAEHLAFRRWSRPVAAMVAIYALITVVCNRGFVGRDVSLLLFSWHAHTWAILALLGLLMGARPTTRSIVEREEPAAPTGGGDGSIRTPKFVVHPPASFHPTGPRRVARAWGSKSS